MGIVNDTDPIVGVGLSSHITREEARSMFYLLDFLYGYAVEDTPVSMGALYSDDDADPETIGQRIVTLFERIEYDRRDTDHALR